MQIVHLSIHSFVCLFIDQQIGQLIISIKSDSVNYSVHQSLESLNFSVPFNKHQYQNDFFFHDRSCRCTW